MNDPFTAPLPLGPLAKSAAEIDRERRDIRSHYSRLILNRMPDGDAFDRCDEVFGFVQSVRALKAVSPRAKKLSDDYWRRRRAAVS